MKIILCSITILLSSTIAFTQNVSKNQVLKDLKLLKKSIKEYNPALNIYNTDFEEKSDALIKSVQNSKSLFEYFSLVSSLCAYSNEGHYSLGSWQDSVHKSISNGTATYLPFSNKIIQNKLYIWDDYTSKNLFIKGDEIISINGLETSKILAQIYARLPSDGNIQTYSERQTSSLFAWLYYLYIEQSPQFEIKYVDYTDKKEKTLQIKALNKNQIRANYKATQPKSTTVKKSKEPQNEIYELQKKDSYAYLKLKSFNRNKLQEQKLKSKSFYKMIFNQINTWKSNYLIIDLRGNLGGRNEFADDVVPFILKEKTTDTFLRKSVSWKGHHKKVYKIPHPSQNVYKGQIYVLVDAFTFSAGSTLARYLKEYGEAIVIGQETGTRYEGFAAGSKQYIFLLNSNLRIGIPRYLNSFPKSSKQTTSNRGLLPDHEVVPTLSDLLNKKDVVLEKAISLME